MCGVQGVFSEIFRMRFRMRLALNHLASRSTARCVCVCVCMCVYVYVCMCVCGCRVCVCVCAHMPFQVTPLSHTQVHVCIYSCYVRRYINTQMHANISLYLPLISKHTSIKEHAVAHRIQGLRFGFQG